MAVEKMADGVPAAAQGRFVAAAREPGSTVNPQIEEAIARYRAEHPERAAYLQSLPRERLESYAILRLIENEELKARLVLLEQGTALPVPAPADGVDEVLR